MNEIIKNILININTLLIKKTITNYLFFEIDKTVVLDDTDENFIIIAIPIN